MSGFERALDQIEREWKLVAEGLEAALAAKTDVHDRQAAQPKGGAGREVEVAPERESAGKSRGEQQQDNQQHIRDAPVNSRLPHGLFEVLQQVYLAQDDGDRTLMLLALAGDIYIDVAALDRAQHHLGDEFLLLRSPLPGE